jgi:quercetin dioxygenase-like cupin family protein
VSSSVAVVRLTEDSSGVSHFDGFQIEQSLTNFAPPAKPFFASQVEKASGYVTVRIPVGWVGETHRSPHRQMLFCLAGVLKVTAGDGTVRMIGAGDGWLMSDTISKGHQSEVASNVPFDAVIILLG